MSAVTHCIVGVITTHMSQHANMKWTYIFIKIHSIVFIILDCLFEIVLDIRLFLF